MIFQKNFNIFNGSITNKWKYLKFGGKYKLG